MIKRGDWASGTSYTDRKSPFDPASERSAGLMLNAFRSREEDAGPASFDRQFAGDTAFAQASGPVRLDQSTSVASIDFPAIIDLATLDGTNGFRIDGIDAEDFSGRSVSDAGDVNGDGFDDVIIGAWGADPGGEEGAGESYVVFGKADGIPASLDLAALNGTNGFRVNGVDSSDASGFSVSGAGDMNGDGFDDIIIGAYNAEGITYGRDHGKAYVVFGHGGEFDPSVNLASLDGADGFRLDGIAYSWAGRSVSSAGDVNGDGYDDVIIGCPAPSSEEYQSGRAFVVFGGGDGFPAVLDLSSLGDNGDSFFGLRTYDQLGIAVSSAGDVNGDGFDDIIIGRSGASASGGTGFDAGESYVVFGSADAFSGVSLGTLDGTDGFRIVGVDDEDFAGTAVSSAGDVNGDGFDDILVGAFSADHHGMESAGESYVVFGKASGFTSSFHLASLDWTNGFRIKGIDAFDSAARISSAGDVNGDGFDDIIIGASGGDPGGDRGAGESYVVFGKADGFAASLDLADIDGTNGFRLDGIDMYDGSGSVSSAGDVNGDGFDDIIIGAPGADPGGDLSAGESYVVFGRAPTEAVTRIGSAANQTIRGGDFNDTLNGESGNDRLGGGVGADTLNGGIGNDWAYYDKADVRVRASLNQPANNSGEAAGDAYISIENLFGSAFNDKLTGDAFANRLRGEGGKDTLSGANGNDVLAGGAGHDSLTGGKGADSFTFGSLLSADSDTIVDFTGGVDRIALDDDIFGFVEGALPPGSFVIGGTAQDADDRVIYDSTTGRLFFDADGTGAAAQILLAVLPGAPTITASDIIVV